MIRAALLTPNLTMGGAELWIISMARSADPSRLRWVGAAASGWGGIEERLGRELASHVKLHTNDGGWNGSSTSNVVKQFAAIHDSLEAAIAEACRDADVLVAWGGIDLLPWTRGLSIPVVLTSHTSEPAVGPDAISGATHFAAVSEAARAYFRGRVDQDRVKVIYNGAETRRCMPWLGRESQRSRWKVLPSDKVVGYLGRHSPEKNPAAAIDAIAGLPDCFQAVYYGGPTPRDRETTRRLREHAHEAAPGRVSFFEPVAHVGDVLAGLDVFMLASHREACSVGMIEAWLAGVPVVATPVGSLPELERRFGRLAITVPPNPSPTQLADAVRRASEEEGKSIAKTARTVAEEAFTSEAMSRRWSAYLAELVRGRSYGPRPARRASASLPRGE